MDFTLGVGRPGPVWSNPGTALFGAPSPSTRGEDRHSASQTRVSALKAIPPYQVGPAFAGRLEGPEALFVGHFGKTKPTEIA
jgi:hypothetical protein